MNEPHSETLVVGEFKGYRLFENAGKDRLRSISSSYIWVPGVNEAFCPAGGRVQKVLRNTPDGPKVVELHSHGFIPDPDCNCGFWFYKTLEGALSHPGMPGVAWMKMKGSPALRARDFGGGYLVAEVLGWGRFVEGEDGYRTEFAKVSALYDTGLPNIGDAASKYDVPIVQLPGSVLEEMGVREGVIEYIGPVEKGHSGRDRPRLVLISGEEYRFWPESQAGAMILSIHVGGRVRFRFEVDPEYRNSLIKEAGRGFST